MAITNGYITDDAFEIALKGSAFTSSGHDDDRDRAIEAASRSIDQFCVRRFYQDSALATRYYTPTDTRHLEVDDISTSTGLVVSQDTGLDNTFEQAWTVDDYSGSFGFRLQPENEGAPWNRLESLAGVWPTVRRSVKVIAKFGYASVPMEVEAATLLLATRYYTRKDAPFGVIDSPAGISNLPRTDPDVASMVGHLRRFVRVDAA